MLAPAPGPTRSRPVVVLDTNVVLDWLLFRDPSSTPLARAILGRQLRWVATAPMRGELAEVLRRGLAAARRVDSADVLGQWDAHAELRSEPPRLPAAMLPPCTDVDDQKFLDLAHASGACWLLSRDKALLRLARRAAGLGLVISTPERWSCAA